MPEQLLQLRPAEEGTINLGESYEVEYWTKKFGCSREELESAVKAVGTEASAVEAALPKASPLPISHLHLQNFRSFQDLKLGPFKRVNLIAGLNNTGKTGLLEAIFLSLRPVADIRQTPPVLLPNLFRVFSQQTDLNENFWPWLFRDKRSDHDVRITATHGDGSNETFVLSKQQHIQEKRHIGLTHTDNLGSFQVRRAAQGPAESPRPAIFASHPSDPAQDAIDYNRVILRRGKKKVEALLRQIDPRLESIEALQTGQVPLIYADIGLPEMIPVSHLGEGFCRLLDIYSELLAGEARVLLIDEIENGLHHSVLPVVWKGLITAARELDVQIFATTHSAECIFAADQAARQCRPYELNLLRLDRVKGEIMATMVDEDAMETAKEFGWELR